MTLEKQFNLCGLLVFYLLSWIGVILLVLEFEKQIKEMLLFKRNDNTTI